MYELTTLTKDRRLSIGSCEGDHFVTSQVTITCRFENKIRKGIHSLNRIGKTFLAILMALERVQGILTKIRIPRDDSPSFLRNVKTGSN
ncbi:hypothetical protein DLM75_06415 [Leptospira stimsonii]|uniref:Uncharacterized protein n=1 Tax=Leptospira stimsonii TaxID=2202203 RepID=A0A396ZGH8_9LEPT|nr:hypothetical protein DLM75_06415 [Leptospira stimsonii]